MSERADVDARISVVWETERPRLKFPRQSNEFSYLGCRWYLSTEMDYRSYTISLHKVKPDEPQDANLHIRTIVVGMDGYCISGYSNPSIRGRLNILSFYLDSAKERLKLEDNHGEWTVYCIFRSDQQTELAMNKTKTIKLSTQTGGIHWPLSAADESSFPENDDTVADAHDDSPSDLESLSSDLCKLFEQESSPDVQLKCGDRTFSAHRLILSARSQVFAAMFRNRMAESETGIVDITDLDGEILDMLLKYAYSGKIPDLSDAAASSLYSAADKYSIHALKRGCSNWIVRSLTTENCLDFLLLADASSDESLKHRVARFAAGVLESLEVDAWSKFNDDHPGLAILVYQRRYAARPKRDP